MWKIIIEIKIMIIKIIIINKIIIIIIGVMIFVFEAPKQATEKQRGTD